MAILDFISHVHLPSSVNMLHRYLKHFTFSSCFWSIVIVIGDGCLEIIITFVSSTFISMPQHNEKNRKEDKTVMNFSEILLCYKTHQCNEMGIYRRMLSGLGSEVLRLLGCHTGYWFSSVTAEKWPNFYFTTGATFPNLYFNPPGHFS